MAAKGSTENTSGGSTKAFFGKIGSGLSKLGQTIKHEAEHTADQINRSVASVSQGETLHLFQSGNIVQLVSRVSGRCLQIVQGEKSLVVDGCGADSADNASWFVVAEGYNQVRLHNNNNFLAIKNGETLILNMPPGTPHGLETKFQLHQQGHFVYIESMKELGKYVGVMPDGQLKPALATFRDDQSQFGVRLLHSTHGVLVQK